MQTLYKQHLLKALLRLRDNRPFDSYIGICSNIDIDYSGMDDDLCSLFKSWDKFSGDSQYPVPSPVLGHSPMFAYNNHENLWEGAYGDLRKDLLQHCINELQKELCNQ